MKNRILLIAFFALVAAGCSKGGDDSLNDVFIPDVSNQWLSSRGTSFVFNADKTGVNQSTFNGFETSDQDSNNFSGSFKNYNISFKFSSGTESGVTYSGNFVKGSSPLKMQVKGSNGVSLTLTRQQ